MSNKKMVLQEKSNEELQKVSLEIVDLMQKRGLNVAEKMKVLVVITEALKATINATGGKLGMIFKEGVKDDKN